MKLPSSSLDSSLSNLEFKRGLDGRFSAEYGDIKYHRLFEKTTQYFNLPQPFEMSLSHDSLGMKDLIVIKGENDDHLEEVQSEVGQEL